MQGNESQREGDGLTPTAPTLRINLPTAAAVAGTEDTGQASDTTHARRHERDTTPLGYRGHLDVASQETMPVRRIVGRSFEERSVAGAVETGQEGDVEEPKTGAFILPDWSDPPTGLVPRVLLDEEDTQGIETDLVETGLRGPRWREEGSDWDNDADLAFLGVEDDSEEEAPVIAGQRSAMSHVYDIDFDEIDFDFGPTGLDADEKWDEAFGDRDDVTRAAPNAASWEEPSIEMRAGSDEPDDGDSWIDPPRRVRHRRIHESETAAKSDRNLFVATAVGVVMGLIALACFRYGPRTTVLLVAFAVTLAAAELYSSLQRSGYRPATLIGIIAVPLMIFGTYLHGPIAVPFVIALLMLGFAIWGISGLTPKDPVLNLGVTALVVLWTGILGSFAGLLLNPNSFPNRHGVAYLVGAITLTVAHDVGSFAVGARLGKHKLAPRVSPGKTREGLIGGSVLTLIVALAIVAHIHPFGLLSALLLGLVVVVFAPLGDLFESVAKRDLGLKDMGRFLPAHGGIFDRIDAMLFVMPACYLLMRLLGKS